MSERAASRASRLIIFHGTAAKALERHLRFRQTQVGQALGRDELALWMEVRDILARRAGRHAAEVYGRL